MLACHSCSPRSRRAWSGSMGVWSASASTHMLGCGSVVAPSSVGCSFLAARADVCVLSLPLSCVPASVVVRSAPRVGLLPCPPRRFAPRPPFARFARCPGAIRSGRLEKNRYPPPLVGFAPVGGWRARSRTAPAPLLLSSGGSRSRSLRLPPPSATQSKKHKKICIFQKRCIFALKYNFN